MSVRSELRHPLSALPSSVSARPAPSPEWADAARAGLRSVCVATRGSGLVSARAYRSSGVVGDGAVLDAALRAVFDGLRMTPGNGPAGDLPGLVRGLICILDSSDPGLSYGELRGVLAGAGDVGGKAVGLIVVGDDARTAAVVIRRLRETAAALGGYVVGPGVFLGRRQAATESCSVGYRLSDITLASSLGLLARRVEVLAAAGHVLRSR